MNTRGVAKRVLMRWRIVLLPRRWFRSRYSLLISPRSCWCIHNVVPFYKALQICADHLSVLRRNLSNSAWRVAVSVKRNESRGIFSMKEPISHAKSGRDIASEGDGVALDIHATVGLIEMPVRVQAPQETVILLRVATTFLRRVRVFHFGYARAMRMSCCARIVDESNIGFRIRYPIPR